MRQTCRLLTFFEGVRFAACLIFLVTAASELNTHRPKCTARVCALITCLQFQAKQRREDTQNAVQADLPGELRQLGRILQHVLQNVDGQLDGLHRSLRLQGGTIQHSAEGQNARPDL